MIINPSDSGLQTFKLDSIWPSYAIMKADVTIYPISGETPSYDAAEQYIWNIVYDTFCNSFVMYDTEEAFKRHFQTKMNDMIRLIDMSNRMLSKIYNLTDDEILENGTALSNMANNPNTTPTDPKVPLAFVSAQTFSVTNNPKLTAYMTALNNIPALKTTYIIATFRPLFISMFDKTIYDYGGND